MPDNISDHYSTFLDNQQILDNVRTYYPDGADLYQLAPIDQLHTGGIKASERLLDSIAGDSDLRVLDIGSGLGGVMRLAHNRIGCEIIGLDLTHQFNQLNAALGKLSNPSLAMSVATADGQKLPFAENSFDLVLYQHSLVNMPDKAAALSECKRVLKEDGYLVLHELVQGPNYHQLRFPVPWARYPEQSHLMTEQTLRQVISDCCFTLTHFEDWSGDALAWRQRQTRKESDTAPANAPLSPAMVLGPDFHKMGRNIMNGLESGALKVVEVRATPSGTKAN